ncbi:hypothetical protein [Bradyrhizobium sp. CCBAU 051011]|jgi:hypothetical protein|uniref:hypothetical protein n=1 Tax=Bradyrhizobium sp. CCBAU 051011 TaxID=858422 RepID=UPI001FED8D94|nr:hypothetical protein [Bradyrhizobium sp. CCBAU 051011]
MLPQSLILSWSFSLYLLKNGNFLGAAFVPIFAAANAQMPLGAVGTIPRVEPKLEQQRASATGEEDMASNLKKPLRPEDFPVDAEGQKIKKQDGTPIADADNPAVADEIVERLNDDEARREEDKWSA